MIVKSESEVAQSCPTLSNPMDCSLPGSSVHGIFQARVLEWGATAFSSAVPDLGINPEKMKNFKDMGTPKISAQQRTVVKSGKQAKCRNCRRMETEDGAQVHNAIFLNDKEVRNNAIQPQEIK